MKEIQIHPRSRRVDASQSSSTATSRSTRPKIYRQNASRNLKLPEPPEPLAGMTCQITGKVMEDPVVSITSGVSYERKEIGKLLPEKSIIPNHALKNLIKEWTKGLPEMREYPEAMDCPVKLEMMTDPVILTVSGISYEDDTIEDWADRWAGKRKTCPITRKPFNDTNIIENKSLAAAIYDWRKKAVQSFIRFLKNTPSHDIDKESVQKLENFLPEELTEIREQAPSRFKKKIDMIRDEVRRANRSW